MGTIKLDKDELLKMAGELSSLKEEVNNILIKTQNTENVLRRETSVSTYSQKNKLTNVQNLAYNLVREFDKISDNFYQAAKAYENTEEKLNRMVNINNNINLANIAAISSMGNTYFNSPMSKNNESESSFDDLKEMAQEGWSLLQDYFEKKIEAVDFLKNICDTVNEKIDGYLENNKELIAEFNEEHPKLSILLRPLEGALGVFDGALMFVKEMTFDLAGTLLGAISYEAHGLLEDPVKTLQENGQTLYTIASILFPITDEQKKIQMNAATGIWEAIKESINTNITNGDSYTASRFITDVCLNVASLFFGAGELKAASSVKKADKAIDGVKVIDKVSDAGRISVKNTAAFENAFSQAAKISSRVSDGIVDLIHTKVDSVFEYVRQTKDFGNKILLQLRKKVYNVEEVKIPKSKLGSAEVDAVLGGCFTEDTLVLTKSGLKEIRNIKEGEFVYSRNEESGQVSLKKIIYTYIKEAKDFIKLKLGTSEIECTPAHLFMLEDGAWMSAEHLKAGDKVINSDGSLVIVERIESLSYNEGKAIYNLNVEDNHTYFVSEEKVCVHNNCMVSSEKVERIFNAIPKNTPKDICWNDFQTLMKGEGNSAEKAEAYFKFVGKDSKIINNVGRSTGNSVGKITEGIGKANYKNIDDFIAGNKNFDDVLDDYAKIYADKINSNVDWSWNKSIHGGERLTIKQKRVIKELAIEKGYIPNVKVKKVDGMRYGFADFDSAGVVKETKYLPEEMWKLSDSEQFKWLDEKIGGHVNGYTWHHTEIPGKMELVPTGIHNIITHNGGRSKGMWADAPR